MAKKVIVINTHPEENREFVGKLVLFLASLGIEPEVIGGYKDKNPLDRNPSHIILSGVPLNADYSLSEIITQKKVNKAFLWLRSCKCPVLGICYGHQILAHIFGGKVSSLMKTISDTRLHLDWNVDDESGIFSEFNELNVFAEHRDFVSEIPPGFKVLSQRDGIPYIMYQPGSSMYGLQFVPEQSDDKAKQIMKRFLEIGEDTS